MLALATRQGRCLAGRVCVSAGGGTRGRGARGCRVLALVVAVGQVADREAREIADRANGEDENLEALRWIIFDNQKVNGFLGPHRFLRCFAKPPGDPAVLAFLKGRIDTNLAIIDKRLSSRPFVLGARPTIADLSLVGYLYYPAEEFGFDIAAQHKNIAVWLDRIKALPGWKHPYDLMPGHPLPDR